MRLLPKPQENIRYPGGDRQQTMHARVTRGAKGDHEVRILDTGSVVNDNPVPTAADPASMSIPRKDVLPMPSEALQGVPALVVAGKAQAGRLLQGYFDDSGSDGQRPPFVLAGYILQSEKWAAFSDDWRAECSRSPKINYFKMFEAVEGRGQFESIEYDIRRYKILKLIEVMNRHGAHGLCSYMNSLLSKLAG
jgi:hypothetical protein